MTSSHLGASSLPSIAVRQANFPGVPSSSPFAATTALPAPIRAPASSIVAAISHLEMASTPASPKQPGQRTRCFVEHLRSTLERSAREDGEGGTTRRLVVDLPDTRLPHHCCDADRILGLTPLHPSTHDSSGPDGIKETVALIKAGAKSLLVTEIEMRAVAAASAEASKGAANGDDDVVTAEELTVSLMDPLTSQRMRIPGKGTECTHIECFDLETFLRATLRATRFSQRVKCANAAKFPTCHPLHTEHKKLGRCDYCKHWRCPICRFPISLGQLEYDAFVGNILEKEPSALRIKVKPSTSQFWPEAVAVVTNAKPAPRNESDSDDSDDSDSESDESRSGGDAKAKREGVAGTTVSGTVAPPSSPFVGNVIELEDSDDDDEAAGEMNDDDEAAEDMNGDDETRPGPDDLDETHVGDPPTTGPNPPATETDDQPKSPPPNIEPPPVPNLSPGTKRRNDLSPPQDPRRPKVQRRTVVPIMALDPVGAAARPTVTTTVTVGAAPPIPKRPPLAVVDEDLFARVGAVLKTVHASCSGDASTALAWCEKACVVKSNESRAIEQLSKWSYAAYEMTYVLTGRNREALQRALTKYDTGVRFQEFRKRVRLHKLLETGNPTAHRIHRALEFMTHTRDFWKAIVRKKPLPAVLRKGADGKFAVDPLSVANGGGLGDAEADGNETRDSSPAAKETGAKKDLQKKSGNAGEKEKEKADAKKTAPKACVSDVSDEPKTANGAAKKYASNAPYVKPAQQPVKEKEKRGLPSACDARGHGHCEWDGVTPLKEHPKLKHVCICEGCLVFYTQAHFSVGNDGYYNQCRCCSDGGGAQSVCCDTCANVFCAPCITNLGGAEYCADVGKVDTWRCFSCDPKAVAKKR